MNHGILDIMDSNFKSNLSNYLKEKNIHVFYISLSAEKALGVPEVLDNFHIICGKTDSFWSKYNNPQNYLVKNENLKNSHELLESKDVINWINSFHADKCCVITFKISPRFEKIAKENKFLLLNNSASLSKFFENKFNLPEISNISDVQIPNSKVITIDENTKINYPSVIQFPFGHTGNSTYIIKNNFEFKDFIRKFGNIQVKISEFIEGIPVNINGVIINNEVFTSGLNIQLTNIKGITENSAVTCGNDYLYSIYDLGVEQIKDIQTICKRIGKFLSSKSYKGLFGIDLVVSNNKTYLIEINARQTANVSMFNEIQNNMSIENSLNIHISSFLNFSMKLPLDYDGISNPSFDCGQVLYRNLSEKEVKVKFPISKFENQLFTRYLGDYGYSFSNGEEIFRLKFKNLGNDLQARKDRISKCVIENLQLMNL